MKLVPILAEKYEYYKQRLMFEGYKWDPQFLDNNTVARHVLVLTKKEAEELADKDNQQKSDKYCAHTHHADKCT